MSNLPSNYLYDLPPRNRQVRFTLKLPSPIYPSNRLYDLPPPEIAKSDLPSNRQVRFTPQIICTIYPPPEIAKSDLPSNRQVRFTPQIVCMIYPPSSWITGMLFNCNWRCGLSISP